MMVTSILSCGGHSLQLTTVFAHARPPEDKVCHDHDHDLLHSSHLCLIDLPQACAVVMQDRDHLHFVCKLKDYVPDQQKLLSSIPAALEQAGMTVQEASIEEAEEALKRDYFKNTKLVDLATGMQLTADVHPSSGNIAPGKQRALHPFGPQQ